MIGGGRWHIYDYALGFIAGWGAHPLDIAHWGYPQIPVEYQGTGRIPTEGLFDTIVDWDLRGRYAGGVEFTMKAGGDATRFVGTERLGFRLARRHFGRAGLALEGEDQARRGPFAPGQQSLPEFPVERVWPARTPASNIDSAVQSDFISHLGDIAIRTGRTIRWDPQQETIVGDEIAQRMMQRAMREPWSLSAPSGYNNRVEEGRTSSIGNVLMPEISRFFGVLVTMYYNDHPPPHFHVRYAGKKALISIENPAILKGHLPPRVLGFVVEWAALRRAELEENWDRARQELPFEVIEPLE